jgi:sulfoxide reductase heme-binding subunit YedZ
MIHHLINHPFFQKYQMWVLTHLGALIMVIMLITNPGNRKILTPYSGYFSVGFLLTILALNPLKKIFPGWMLITKLNRFRRELGVAVFSYAAIHLICFIIKRGSLQSTLPYIFHPALTPVFLVGFPLFFILAITSNKYSVRKLTFMKWKKLHRKVYIAEGAVILHMILVGEKFWTAILFTPLFILQLIRIWKK